MLLRDLTLHVSTALLKSHCLPHVRMRLGVVRKEGHPPPSPSFTAIDNDYCVSELPTVMTEQLKKGQVYLCSCLQRF